MDVSCDCSWSITYGPLLLGLMAGIHGAIFTGHFRHRMMLWNRARMASYIPSVVIPGIVTATAQQTIVFGNLIDRKTDCLLCSQISAVSVQVRMSKSVVLKLNPPAEPLTLPWPPC